MIKNLVLRALVALSLISPALAQTQYAYPSTWYFQVTDTNPSTQVFNNGSMIGNNSPAFHSFLTAFATTPVLIGNPGIGLAFSVCGAANNGSGLVRVTVCNPQNGFATWSTGQFKTIFGLSGVTGANSTFAITVISQTAGVFDLQGSTFGGAWSGGGTVGAGSVAPTLAGLFTLMNSSVLSQWVQYGTVLTQTLAASDLMLTDPVPHVMQITMGASGHVVEFSFVNTFQSSVPIGWPVVIQNAGGTNAFNVVDFSASDVLATINAGETYNFYLLTNTTQQGTWLAVKQ